SRDWSSDVCSSDLSSTDKNLRIGTRLSIRNLQRDTGHFALHLQQGILSRCICKLLGVDLADGCGYGSTALFAVANNHDLVEVGLLRGQRNVETSRGRNVHHMPAVTDRGKHDLGAHLLRS